MAAPAHEWGGFRERSKPENGGTERSFCVSKTLTPLMRHMFGPGPPLDGGLNLIKQQDNFLDGSGQPTHQSSLPQMGWERGGLLSSRPETLELVSVTRGNLGGFDLWLTFRKDQPLISATCRLTIFSPGWEDFPSESTSPV